MPDKFLITLPQSSALEQPIPINQRTTDKIMNQISEIVEYAISEKTPEPVVVLIHDLVEIQQLAGYGLAKALWLLAARWSELGMEDAFEDYVYAEVGKDKNTISRYVKVWSLLNRVSNDPDLQHELMQRPIGDIIAVVQREAAIGTQFDKRTLLKLAGAVDTVSLRNILQNREEAAESSPDRIKFSLGRTGELVVFCGEKRATVGLLRNTPRDLKGKEGELRERAIGIIEHKLGVIRDATSNEE